jgi:enoyl-CoA hydratase
MTLPDYETLALSRVDDHILLVTMNRPDVLNAINTQMGIDTLDLWTRLTPRSRLGLRCVVLTGAGDRAFCAGGDLKQRNTQA